MPLKEIWLGVVNAAFLESHGCGKCTCEPEEQEGTLEIQGVLKNWTFFLKRQINLSKIKIGSLPSVVLIWVHLKYDYIGHMVSL